VRWSVSSRVLVAQMFRCLVFCCVVLALVGATAQTVPVKTAVSLLAAAATGLVVHEAGHVATSGVFGFNSLPYQQWAAWTSRGMKVVFAALVLVAGRPLT
jgi:hypothetical protein